MGSFVLDRLMVMFGVIFVLYLTGIHPVIGFIIFWPICGAIIFFMNSLERKMILENLKKEREEKRKKK